MDIISGQKWTMEEDKLLQELYEIESIDEIQKKHFPNRTKKAIQYRAGKLGLRKYMIWDDDIDQILKLLKRAGCTNKQIGKLLDRSESEVSNRAYKLGIKFDSLENYDYSNFIHIHQDSLNTNHLAVGKCTELYVESLLLKRGYDVLRPFTFNHKVDYLVVNELSTVKIQVKTGTYEKERKRFRANLSTKDSKRNRITYDSSVVDFFIVKCNGTDDIYVIPFSEGNGHSISLYPHRTRRYREKKVDFEIYKNAFHLIEEKLNIKKESLK